VAAFSTARSKPENQSSDRTAERCLFGAKKAAKRQRSTSDKRRCTEKRRLQYQEQKQSEEQQQNEILDVRGAAAYLHCSPSHVSNILNGRIPNLPPIPHVRAGRLRLIRKESLIEWFKVQEATSLETAAKC